ncbi:amt-3 [Symbiodinium pilosum]|uniref:Amt-3 protein n=1 Tax=Symbiodinium pilosum TaxID=2952 RepID=A0A812XHS9_SYMPI|nr:amt-3 [Symbiodinium pilosum]
MLQSHSSAPQSTKPAFLQSGMSLAELPNDATCKKKFTDNKVCKTTSGVDCTHTQLETKVGKCWFSETSGRNPCKPYPVSGTWTTAKVDFEPDEAGVCFDVPMGICPVQICVKSGSPNSGAGRFCYSGKQTCGTNGGPSNGKVDQTFCTKWTAPDKFCVVSLATNNNNPNNIQDLSNFAIQFGCCDGSGGVVGDPHIHTLDGNEFDLYDKGTYSVFHYGGTVAAHRGVRFLSF